MDFIDLEPKLTWVISTPEYPSHRIGCTAETPNKGRTFRINNQSGFWVSVWARAAAALIKAATSGKATAKKSKVRHTMHLLWCRLRLAQSAGLGPDQTWPDPWVIGQIDVYMRGPSRRFMARIIALTVRAKSSCTTGSHTIGRPLNPANLRA